MKTAATAWKVGKEEWAQSRRYNKWLAAVEEMLERTSTSYAPWYVIPADNKRGARVIVASIVFNQLKKYKDIDEPELEEEIRSQIDLYKQQLENEA